MPRLGEPHVPEGSLHVQASQRYVDSHHWLAWRSRRVSPRSQSIAVRKEASASSAIRASFLPRGTMEPCPMALQNDQKSLLAGTASWLTMLNRNDSNPLTRPSLVRVGLPHAAAGEPASADESPPALARNPLRLSSSNKTSVR